MTSQFLGQYRQVTKNADRETFRTRFRQQKKRPPPPHHPIVSHYFHPPKRNEVDLIAVDICLDPDDFHTRDQFTRRFATKSVTASYPKLTLDVSDAWRSEMSTGGSSLAPGRCVWRNIIITRVISVYNLYFLR